MCYPYPFRPKALPRIKNGIKASCKRSSPNNLGMIRAFPRMMDDQERNEMKCGSDVVTLTFWILAPTPQTIIP